MENPHLNFVQVPRAFQSDRYSMSYYQWLSSSADRKNLQASKLKEKIYICFFLKSHENPFRPTKAIVYEQTID